MQPWKHNTTAAVRHVVMAVPASMAFVTDSNRPQPLWQPPSTPYLTASGAAFEPPSPLTHSWVPLPSSECRPVPFHLLSTAPRLPSNRFATACSATPAGPRGRPRGEHRAAPQTEFRCTTQHRYPHPKARAYFWAGGGGGGQGWCPWCPWSGHYLHQRHPPTVMRRQCHGPREVRRRYKC